MRAPGSPPCPYLPSSRSSPHPKPLSPQDDIRGHAGAGGGVPGQRAAEQRRAAAHPGLPAAAGWRAHLRGAEPPGRAAGHRAERAPRGVAPSGLLLSQREYSETVPHLNTAQRARHVA